MSAKFYWAAVCRYEGEWMQNQMEGHGVIEVDIPTMEPIPGSKYVFHAMVDH